MSRSRMTGRWSARGHGLGKSASQATGAGRARRSIVLGTSAIALVAHNGLSANAATKSTAKSPAKSTATATSSTKSNAKTSKTNALATAKATTTTAPPARSSGTPIKGWDRINPTDWPARGDSVTAVATSKALEVLRAPGDRNGALRLEQGRSMFGPIRLLALDTRDGWIKVAIPIRPNGTVGWVRASDVDLKRNSIHIELELDSNTMRVFDGDQVVIQQKVGAGTNGTPTPTGLFFVKELVPQRVPTGALGPYAFGLSGFSNVLSGFGGGEGTIGIHGTNAPGKLGGDVSHGCVRVANAPITSMTKIVPLGTPVAIVNRWSELPTARRASSWISTVGSENAPASQNETADATAATEAPITIDAIPVGATPTNATVTKVETTETTISPATAAPSSPSAGIPIDPTTTSAPQVS